MKVALRVLVALLLTALLLFLWLRGTDLHAMARHLRDARLPYLPVIVGLALLHCLVRAYRWRLLIADARLERPGVPAPALRLLDLFKYTVIGYAVTFTVPGRLGEIVRPALLWRRHSVPFGTAVASVLLERFLDALTLIALLLAFVILSPELAGPAVVKGALVAAAVAVAGCAALLVVQRRTRGQVPAAAHRVARIVPIRFAAGVERLVAAFLGGFDVLLRPGSWWRLPATSLATWIAPILVLPVALAATSVDVDWTASLLLTPLTALGIAIPTPAGIGGYHALMSFGLTSMLSVPAEQAAAAAVVAHAVQVIPVILLGLYFSWREGLGIGSLRATIETARETEIAGGHPATEDART